MRLLSIGAIFAVLLASGPTRANQEQLLANICNYVQSDDKIRLRKKLKDSRVKLRSIYTGTTCNGLSLLRFAMTSGSDNVGSYIAKRLPSAKLKEAEADGSSIIDWANGNNYGASPIITVIKQRIAG